jgi:enoyl-CoA hydratase/carnithine racemase
LVDANEAAAAGLATAVVPVDDLQKESATLAAELSTRARSTIVATKAMLIRLRDHRRPPAGLADDIITACYGSGEFREGVRAFLGGRRPEWK